MSQPIRAIYEKGNLRLLDKVDLLEGEEVTVTILTEQQKLRAILGDLLVPREELTLGLEDIDEEALMAEIREATRGIPSISELIIQERQEGP